MITKLKTIGAILAGVLASGALTAQAAEFLRLPGSTDLTDGNYWTTNGVDVGVAPGSSDVAFFDSATVPDTNGVTYGSASVYWGGMKFDNITGPITFSGITYAQSNLGIVATNTSGRISFSNWRCNNSAYTGMGPVLVGTNCTLAFNAISCKSRSAYTIDFSGGGTVLVNGTAAPESGSRMMFSVSGTNTTIGGNGTWKAGNSNSGLGMQIGTGSYIAPGDNGVGTMTIDSSIDNTGVIGLRLADGSGLKFELGTGGAGFALPSSDSDQIVLTGMASNDVVFQGTTTIDFQGTGTNGVYKLLDTDLDAGTWSGLTVSNEVFIWSGNAFTNQVITGGLVVTNLASGLPPAELIMGDGTNGDPGDIYLVIGELDLPYNPGSVFWATGSGNWDINSSLNWSNNAGPAVYYEKTGVGDNVTFDDRAPGSSHTISLNTNVYPSAMTVNSSNNYSFSGTGDINGSTALNKAGSGMLTITMANSYFGGTTIAGGTINFTDANALGSGTITMAGGTLQSGANYVDFNLPLFADAGKTGTLIMTDRCTINAALSGTGTLNVQAPSTLGGTRDYMSNPCAGFNGSLNISGGGRLDLLANGGSFDANLSGAAVNIDNEQVYSRNWSYGLTIQLGALSGTASAVLAGDTVGGASTWQIGAKNLDTDFAGVIQDGVANGTMLTKVGTGTLTLSGTNTYTGATTVNDGTLNLTGAILNSAATVNGGTLYVDGSLINDITVNGGKLSIAGSASISNVTVNAGGTIAGGGQTYGGGAGTVGGSLTLNDGAMVVFNTNGLDHLWVSGSLNVTNTFSAANVVVDSNDWSGVPNNTYILVWGYTNTISGVDSSEHYIGGGRTAHLVDESGDIALVIGDAAPVPNISSASVSGGSMTLTWGSGTYNVYTNSDLSNTNGWGVATNANSSVDIPVGSETNLFYKLGY